MTNHYGQLLADSGHSPDLVAPTTELADQGDLELPVVPTTPRLARGVVWSDLIAEMEREQEIREREAVITTAKPLRDAAALRRAHGGPTAKIAPPA